MIKSFFILSVLLIFSTNLQSSELLNEAKEDIISPYNTDAIKILEVGGGLTLVTLLFKNEFKYKLQNDISSDRPLKQYSKWGDLLGRVVPNIAYFLAMGSDYLLTKDQIALDRAILMGKATLYAGAMADIIKPIVQERRPNGSTRSFPSGHSTTAFAFSSIVAMEHSLPWGIAANAMAAFVGFSRVNDNAHYIHDVLAGATIGAMYGVGVYNAKKNRDVKKTDLSTFLIVPLKDGMVANYSFLF